MVSSTSTGCWQYDSCFPPAPNLSPRLLNECFRTNQGKNNEISSYPQCSTEESKALKDLKCLHSSTELWTLASTASAAQKVDGYVEPLGCAPGKLLIKVIILLFVVVTWPLRDCSRLPDKTKTKTTTTHTDIHKRGGGDRCVQITSSW